MNKFKNYGPYEFVEDKDCFLTEKGEKLTVDYIPSKKIFEARFFDEKGIIEGEFTAEHIENLEKKINDKIILKGYSLKQTHRKEEPVTTPNLAIKTDAQIIREKFEEFDRRISALEAAIK